MKNARRIITTILIATMILSLTPSSVSAAKLKKPSKMKVKSITSTYNTIKVKWKKAKKSSKVKQYQIKVAGVKTYTVKGRTKTAKTIKGLKAGTTYKVQIRAKNKKGYSKWSKTKKIATKSLSQVSNVKVSSKANSNKVTIQFDAVSGADKYAIKRTSKDNPTFQIVGTVQGTQTLISYVDSNVKADMTYYYKVIPMVGSEEAITSSTSYEITPSATSDIVGKEVNDLSIPFMKLPAITKLNVNMNKKGTYKSWANGYDDTLKKFSYKYVNISWEKVDGADGYIVERYGNASKTWIKVKTTKDTSYAVPELLKGIETKIRVCAYKKDNGTTIYSNYTQTTIKPKKTYWMDGKVKVDKNHNVYMYGYYRFYSEEAFIIQNKYREEKRLNPLVWSETIYKVAKQRSLEQVDCIGHMRADGRSYWQTIRDVMGDDNYYNYGGPSNFRENAAWNQGTPKAVMKDWKASSGHYDAIIDKDYTCGAISLYVNDGETHWISLFSESTIK